MAPVPVTGRPNEKAESYMVPWPLHGGDILLSWWYRSAFSPEMPSMGRGISSTAQWAISLDTEEGDGGEVDSHR